MERGDSHRHENQLKLFDMPQAVALIGLHRYRCPDVPVAFFHPRLFNPSKPIPELHDDSFDNLGVVIDFPQTPDYKDAA